MALADRTGERLGADAYGYRVRLVVARWSRSRLAQQLRRAVKAGVVLDPTAGGGSIPLEQCG